MTSPWKGMLIGGAKLASIIAITHLYIGICAFVYTRLESNEEPLNESIDNFLVQLKEGHYAKDDTKSVLRTYHLIQNNEKKWRDKEWFSNYPYTYVFVLAAHTTLGNRHMNVKTKNGQLFYILTVPIGVLLYYVMIHMASTKLVREVKNASMLVWRREDDDLTDRERDIFIRIKLFLTMLTLTMVLILSLGLVSIVYHTPFITEIVYIIDILYTVSASENFVLYELNEYTWNAVVTTFIFFILILFAFATSSTIVSLFWHHQNKHVFAYCFGDWIYKYCCDNDEVDCGNTRGVWDDYKPVSLNDVPEDNNPHLSVASNTSWLHNDGDQGSGLVIPKDKKDNHDNERYVEN